VFSLALLLAVAFLSGPSVSSAEVVVRHPLVAMAATSSGNGYWLVGADGGVFAFGDAPFHGSMGGKSLQAPAVAIGSHSDTGYWLLGLDGGVFAFGSSDYLGRVEYQDSPTGPCPPSNSPAENGLQPNTLQVLRCVKQRFDKIQTFYGVRDDPIPDHPSGRAVDIMVSSAYQDYKSPEAVLAVDIMVSSAYQDYKSPEAVAYGTDIAEWVRKNHHQLGVRYIIWRQQIWNIERDAEGWRPMKDRGGDTANHMDHVHVTTY